MNWKIGQKIISSDVIKTNEWKIKEQIREWKIKEQIRDIEQ